MTRAIQILFIGILIVIWNQCYAQEFIIGDTISSSITFSDIPDTSLPLIYQSSSEFKIDIDGDQVFDIKFTRAHISGQVSWHIWHFVHPLDSIQFACDTSDFNADTLLRGSIIDNSLNWKYNSAGARLFEKFNSSAPPPWGPPSYEKGLYKKDSLYLGFRKIHEGDTLYGWFCLECTSSSLVIKSFATNRDHSSIPDYQFEEELKIYPNPANQFLTIKTGIKSGMILIYNLNGKLFFSNTNLAKATVDISRFPLGMYLIVVETDNNRVAGKLIKQ